MKEESAQMELSALQDELREAMASGQVDESRFDEIRARLDELIKILNPSLTSEQLEVFDAKRRASSRLRAIKHTEDNRPDIK